MPEWEGDLVNSDEYVARAGIGWWPASLQLSFAFEDLDPRLLQRACAQIDVVDRMGSDLESAMYPLDEIVRPAVLESQRILLEIVRKLAVRIDETRANKRRRRDSRDLGMLWVSKAVKHHATVLLTGDGGDDVYLGYPFVRNAAIAQRLARHLPPVAPALWRVARRSVPNGGPARRLKNLLDFATGGIGEYLRAHDGLPYYEQRNMLGEKLAEKQLSQRQIPASFGSARHLLSDMLAHHRNVHFTSEFMQKVDGGTMYYALEARAPFLDQKLWEFASALPMDLHFRGGRLKAILRQIACRRIGPEVAYRAKQGFTIPVERLLADRWSGMLDRLRENTTLERDGWIRPGTLQTTLREAVASRWVPVQIWRLLVLEQWLQNDSQHTKQSSSPHAPVWVA